MVSQMFPIGRPGLRQELLKISVSGRNLSSVPCPSPLRTDEHWVFALFIPVFIDGSTLPRRLCSVPASHFGPVNHAAREPGNERSEAQRLDYAWVPFRTVSDTAVSAYFS